MKQSIALISLFLALFSSLTCAQDLDQAAAQELERELAQEPSIEQTAEPNEAVPLKAPNTAKKPAQIKEATITLQTTVTGNQEQPRVLYILPWQSPLTGEVEFQTLISQQEEVFGHLEREELRRTLEAVEAMDKAK